MRALILGVLTIVAALFLLGRCLLWLDAQSDVEVRNPNGMQEHAQRDCTAALTPELKTECQRRLLKAEIEARTAKTARDSS